MNIFEFAKRNNVAIDKNGNTFVLFKDRIWGYSELLEPLGAKHSILGWTTENIERFRTFYYKRIKLEDFLKVDNLGEYSFDFAKIQEMYYAGKLAEDVDRLNKAIVSSYNIPMTNDILTEDMLTYIYGTPDTVDIEGLMEATHNNIYLIEINNELYFAYNKKYNVPCVELYISDVFSFNEYGVIIEPELTDRAKSKIWYTFNNHYECSFPDEEKYPFIYCGNVNKLKLTFIRGRLNDGVYEHKCVGEDGLNYYFETTENWMLFKNHRYTFNANIAGIKKINNVEYVYLTDVEIW